MERKSILTQQQQAALAKGRQEREESLALYRKICDGEITLEEAMKIKGIPYDPTPPSREERAEWIRATNAEVDRRYPNGLDVAISQAREKETDPDTEWYAKIGKGVVIFIGFLIAILITIWRFAD